MINRRAVLAGAATVPFAGVVLRLIDDRTLFELANNGDSEAAQIWLSRHAS